MAGPFRKVTKPRWRRYFVCGLAVLLAIVIGVGYHQYRQPRLDLEAALAAADAHDSRWRLDEILQDRASLDDHENGALIATAARRLAPANWPAEILSLELYQLPPEQALTEVQHADLKREAERAGEAIKTARRLVTVPRGRFPLQIKEDVLGTILHSVDARYAANLLVFDAMLQAYEGNLDLALDEALATFNASRAVGDEPFLESARARLAVRGRALQSAERTLAQGEAAATTLARLQEEFQNELDENVFYQSLRGERAAWDNYCQALTAGKVNPRIILGGGPSGYRWVDELIASARSVPVRSHAQLLAIANAYVEVAKLPYAERRQALPGVASLCQDLTPVAASRVSAIDVVLGADHRGQALLRAGVVALAVERHRQAHGAWPNRLEDLVPTFLESALEDPFTGLPLLYRRLADGVVVYSVGEDLVDDQGLLMRPSYRGTGTDVGFRLWDTASRRQPKRKGTQE